MYRIGLVLLALALTVAPARVLVGGCGGGRMGRMEAMTGNTNDATGGGVGVSTIAQRHGRLVAAALVYRVPPAPRDVDRRLLPIDAEHGPRRCEMRPTLPEPRS